MLASIYCIRVNNKCSKLLRILVNVCESAMVTGTPLDFNFIHSINDLRKTTDELEFAKALHEFGSNKCIAPNLNGNRHNCTMHKA